MDLLFSSYVLTNMFLTLRGKAGMGVGRACRQL